MRLGTSVAAAVGAAVLVMTLPTPASAATGTFTASFFAAGHEQTVTLTDPANDTCVNAAEDGGAPSTIEGAKNATDAVATLYEQDDCTGTATTIAAGANDSSGTRFRSVKFASP